MTLPTCQKQLHCGEREGERVTGVLHPLDLGYCFPKWEITWLGMGWGWPSLRTRGIFLCPEDVLDLDRRGLLLSLTSTFLGQAEQEGADFRKTAIEAKNIPVE